MRCQVCAAVRCHARARVYGLRQCARAQRGRRARAAQRTTTNRPRTGEWRPVGEYNMVWRNARRTPSGHGTQSLRQQWGMAGAPGCRRRRSPPLRVLGAPLRLLAGGRGRQQGGKRQTVVAGVGQGAAGSARRARVRQRGYGGSVVWVANQRRKRTRTNVTHQLTNWAVRGIHNERTERTTQTNHQRNQTNKPTN